MEGSCARSAIGRAPVMYPGARLIWPCRVQRGSSRVQELDQGRHGVLVVINAQVAVLMGSVEAADEPRPIPLGKVVDAGLRVLQGQLTNCRSSCRAPCSASSDPGPPPARRPARIGQALGVERGAIVGGASTALPSAHVLKPPNHNCRCGSLAVLQSAQPVVHLEHEVGQRLLLRPLVRLLSRRAVCQGMNSTLLCACHQGPIVGRRPCAPGRSSTGRPGVVLAAHQRVQGDAGGEPWLIAVRFVVGLAVRAEVGADQRTVRPRLLADVVAQLLGRFENIRFAGRATR